MKLIVKHTQTVNGTIFLSDINPDRELNSIQQPCYVSYHFSELVRDDKGIFLKQDPSLPGQVELIPTEAVLLSLESGDLKSWSDLGMVQVETEVNPVPDQYEASATFLGKAEATASANRTREVSGVFNAEGSATATGTKLVLAQAVALATSSMTASTDSIIYAQGTAQAVSSMMASVSLRQFAEGLAQAEASMTATGIRIQQAQGTATAIGTTSMAGTRVRNTSAVGVGTAWVEVSEEVIEGI